MKTEMANTLEVDKALLQKQINNLIASFEKNHKVIVLPVSYGHRKHKQQGDKIQIHVSVDVSDNG